MRMTTIRAGFRGRGLAAACAWLLAAAPAAAQGVPGCMKTEVTYRDPAPIPREAVVQVRSPRTAGTGFLIGNDLLLTSRHLVAADGAAAPPRIDVHIPEKPFGRLDYAADHVADDDALDVALYRVDDAADPLEMRPLDFDYIELDKSSQEILLYGYSGMAFGEAATPTPAEGALEIAAGGNYAAYDSKDGDSGSPVIRTRTGLVIGLHRGRHDVTRAREIVLAGELLVWLEETLAAADAQALTEDLFDLSMREMSQRLNPRTCGMRCWNNLTLAAMVAHLQSRQDLSEAQLARVRCPLLHAVTLRRMMRSYGDLRVKLAAAAPSSRQATVDFARGLMNDAQAGASQGLYDAATAQTAYGEASTLLFESALVRMRGDDGRFRLGPICEDEGGDPAAALARLRGLASAVFEARPIPAPPSGVVAELMAEDAAAVCSGGAEGPAALLFDAGVAQRRVAEIALEAGGDVAANGRAQALMAATVLWTSEPRRRAEALMAIAAGSRFDNPAQGALASAEAWRLGLERAEGEFDFLRGLAETQPDAPPIPGSPRSAGALQANDFQRILELPEAGMPNRYQEM